MKLMRKRGDKTVTLNATATVETNVDLFRHASDVILAVAESLEPEPISGNLEVTITEYPDDAEPRILCRLLTGEDADTTQ